MMYQYRWKGDSNPRFSASVPQKHSCYSWDGVVNDDGNSAFSLQGAVDEISGG